MAAKRRSENRVGKRRRKRRERRGEEREKGGARRDAEREGRAAQDEVWKGRYRYGKVAISDRVKDSVQGAKKVILRQKNNIKKHNKHKKRDEQKHRKRAKKRSGKGQRENKESGEQSAERRYRTENDCKESEREGGKFGEERDSCFALRERGKKACCIAKNNHFLTQSGVIYSILGSIALCHRR